MVVLNYAARRIFLASSQPWQGGLFLCTTIVTPSAAPQVSGVGPMSYSVCRCAQLAFMGCWCGEPWRMHLGIWVRSLVGLAWNPTVKDLCKRSLLQRCDDWSRSRYVVADSWHRCTTPNRLQALSSTCSTASSHDTWEASSFWSVPSDHWSSLKSLFSNMKWDSLWFTMCMVRFNIDSKPYHHFGSQGP